MNSNKALHIAGFVLGLAGIFVIALTLGQHSVERKLRSNINRQIAMHSEDVTATYKSVKANFLSRKVSVNGIEFTSLSEKNPNRLSLKIDHFELSDLDFETIAHLVTDSSQPILPKSLRVGLLGVHFTGELLGTQAAKFLADYQYNELNVSLAMGLKFNRDAKTMRFDDVGLEIADLGKISTTWDFSQIDLPSDEELANPKAAKDLLARKWKTAALHYADLKYVDLGFLKRFDQHNQAQGKPSLAKSAEMLAAMMGRSPAKLSFVNDAIPKVQDFLTNGGTITLKAAPAKDQPFVELANPMAFLDPNAFATQIGLSVEVTH